MGNTYGVHSTLIRIGVIAADVEANRLGIPKRGEHNGIRDGFRHTYISAVAGYMYGASKAKQMGDNHEREAPNMANETNMDVHNNALGSQIGEDVQKNGGSIADVGQAVKDALDLGLIITSIDDPRILKLSQLQPGAETRESIVTSSPTIPAQGGQVFVHAYDRRNGHVNAYTRSRPSREF
jgi:hypothetical protein